MIVGVFPQLSAAGGVQRASRLTAAALVSFAVRRGYRCSLLSLNDSPDASHIRFGSEEIAFTGLPALLSTVPDLHLVAIGDGTDLPRLEGLAKQLGVSAHVHFLGQMQPEEVSVAYGACELFALPSRGEGFGLVFLEAMSHGKPVIGGAHGGTPEIIEEGITGYLVQHGDVTQLTERLLHLMSDESCRRQMGEKAFARARSDFTYPRFSKELTGLLDHVLAS